MFCYVSQKLALEGCDKTWDQCRIKLKNLKVFWYVLLEYKNLTKTLGGPESIMSCMMLSGLPRLVGGLLSSRAKVFATFESKIAPSR